ncbi:MAG: tetratricopeptide repeat protein [Gallionella sp.]|nr:tetratricopeptide repeat protein [Gallionella sp.]MDD4945309.1 tetratricopeptide repeat protein [Gallionella sp.]MDD5611661.1 tetratricopeptide repeat protein [Gallionella sp.]
MNQKILLTLVLLLSGLSGISYEILYGRILGGILGDQFAVSSAVLITFLLGIGVGARYAHRLWSKLWLIEGMIGVYGISFALSRDAIEHLLYNGMSFLPSLAGPILLGTVLLLLPALMLGCSVPLFAGYIERMNNSPMFSRVYSIYNFGAAATALLIEFWLIRQFGITGTVIVFGSVNLLAAGLLYLSAKDIAAVAPVIEEASDSKLPRNHIVALLLVSVASAVFQLFMVKMAELMYGPFRESFAFVLAIILFGISFGAFLVKRLNVNFAKLMMANVIGLLLFIVLFRDLLYVYADLYEKAISHGEAIWILKGGILVLLMGIPAVTFGATIPALLDTKSEVAKESGYLLYLSSLANVGGFLLMALVLHQYLDYGVQLLVISALTTAALIAYKWKSGKSWRDYRMSAAALLVLLATAGWHHWKWDEDLLYLSYTSFHSAADMESDRKAFNFPEKFKGYQDVFSINWTNGNPYFFINGYISIPMNNPSEKIVGTIGPMFSPVTKEALVLGLGSGATASAVGLLYDHTDVVEINPVVRDNQFRMKQWNFDIEHNPRVNIVVDDGIHYIQSVDKRYDMILNTVTSPLYFSSSKLYTVDFFDKIKRRLNPEGVYLTWMDSRIGSDGARIILNTLRQKFKHCSIVFIKSGYYLLLASDEPVKLRHPDLVAKAPQLETFLLEHKIVPRSLGYNVLSSEVFTDKLKFDAPVNTIDQPVLEFAMASLKKKEFKEFQMKIYDTVSLEDVEASVEPAMKYDPVEHLAHIQMALKGSTIADRFTQLGRLYVRDVDSRVDDATLVVYQIMAEKLNDAESHHLLGDQYRLRERYSEAVEEYRKALQLDPQHRDTLFNLAASQEYQGLLDEAFQNYQLSGKQNPKDMDVPFRLARISLKQGKITEALEYIQQKLDKEPSEKAYALKAHILTAAGKRDEAVEAYRGVLAFNPDDAEAQYEVNQAQAKW